MFVPPHFKISESDALGIVKQEAFAALVDLSDAHGHATHLPLMLETTPSGQHRLYGHFAKGNPQAETVEKGTRVMAIFSGPHDYVSPTWYEQPNVNVPTWNYVAVHVYGRIKALSADDAEQSIRNLCDRYEQQWNMDLLPAKSLEKMLTHGIVPFVLEVEDIQGKGKLSQNKSGTDRRHVIARLEKSGANELAGYMKRAFE
jgi:transcriptional regulator